MSGNIFLDTNAVINALNSGLVLPPAQYHISFITEMELLSFSELAKNEEEELIRLIENFYVVNINNSIKREAIALRKAYRIKLPDSIICASAIVTGARLITDDKQLFTIKYLHAMRLDDYAR